MISLKEAYKIASEFSWKPLSRDAIDADDRWVFASERTGKTDVGGTLKAVNKQGGGAYCLPAFESFRIQGRFPVVRVPDGETE